MNYREKIQQMVAQINKLYNDAEWLRDFATSDEKEYWNKHRGIFYDAGRPLRMLDDSLSKERAMTCLCDDYKKWKHSVTCKNCKDKFYMEFQECNSCKVIYKDAICGNCGEEFKE